ncbi:MAG: tetratricopeptide repeat protein [Spirochaetales bacterium]|nr:tetratricopeptide repeat protein [Spirochaetales bacterium]
MFTNIFHIQKAFFFRFYLLVHPAGIRYTHSMKGCLFLYVLFSFLVLGCVTPPEPLRVRYDAKRDLYLVDSGEKRGAVLRDEQGTIIREVSDKDRLIEQYNNNPGILSGLPLEFENTGFFVRQEYTIAFLYFSGVKELNKGNYKTSLDFFKRAEEKYPGIIKYSDISFLMGYCSEQLGDREKAKEYYERFINKSEQKYSMRFNEIDRINADLYRSELDYSRGFINPEPFEFDVSFTRNETVKYFNNYHYPGYAVGLYPGLSSLGITILPNFMRIEESYVSLGMSYTFNSWFDAGGAMSFPLPFSCEILSDFQLYKTNDRRFGISLETFLFYQYHESAVIDNEQEELDPPLHYYNAGIKPGAGFYILPDLYIGGYYLYYLFNEYYRFKFESSGTRLETWHTNSYRISLRYLPFKIADLDVSFWNNELYLGANVYVYTYTLFLGYAILENRFVIRLNSRDLID